MENDSKSIVFDKEWFAKHQKPLVWLINSWLGRLIFRYKKMGHHPTNRIVGITPNSIVEKIETGELKQHFFGRNEYARKLYFVLLPMWWAMHAWDWAIGDRELFPQLNAGIRNLGVSMSLSTHSVSHIIKAVATGTEVKPVGNISKIFTRFIGKLDAFGFSTFFARLRFSLLSSYSTMKSHISGLIPLPVHILFSENPDINLTSNPWLMTYSAFITNKAFRNKFSGFKRWFNTFLPNSITRVRTKSSWSVFATLFGLIRTYIKDLSTSFAYNLLHILSINLSWSFSTLTANPVAGANSPVDGTLWYSGVGLVWAVLIAAAGDTAYVSSTQTYIMGFEDSGASTKWSYFKRSIFLFDTSALTSASTISAAVLSLYGVDKSDTGTAVTPDVDIYLSTPANTNNLVAADLAQVGSTSQTGSPITYANYSITAYNDFTFNATGQGNVSKTGISKFGARNANYDVAASTPTWSSGAVKHMWCNYADNATNKPKLVVTYTLPITSTAMFNFF